MLSIAASVALGYREGGFASGGVVGVGGWVSYERGPVVVALEFITGDGGSETLAGLQLGAGAVLSLSTRIPLDLILFGSLAWRESTKWEGNMILGGSRYGQTDYVVLYPHLRFGTSWFVQAGPQMGIGIQEVTHYYSDYSSEVYTYNSLSFGFSAQLGYRF